MSELFKKVRNQYKNKLPFVVYCKPNSNKTIAFFQHTNELFEIENSSKAGFAIVSFDNLQRYLLPEDECDLYFEKNDATDYVMQPEAPQNSIVNQDAKLDFINLVTKGIKSIKNNAFEKIVLSRKITLPLTDVDLELIFKKLVFNYKSDFKSIFYHPKIGLWIGATPEQLLKVAGSKIKTVSLAGTQIFDKNNNTVWENKETTEQQIVTDYLTEILEQITDKVTVSKPYNYRAGNLVHLKTDLEAEITDALQVLQLTNRLHPTPAVCGFPTEKAKQFVAENENYDREFYSGFIGEWQKNFETYRENDSDLFVNLRCMKLTANQAQLFVGCGITKDSNAEKEFIETQNKLHTMMAIL